MHAARLKEAALATVLASVLLYVAATGLSARGAAGLFPAIIGIAGSIAALWNLGLILTGRAEPPASPGNVPDGAPNGPPEERWLAGLSIGAPIAYAVLLWIFGFWIASAAVLLVLPWILGYRRPWLLIAVAACTLLLIRLVFVDVFGMHLPEGWLFERLLDVDGD